MQLDGMVNTLNDRDGSEGEIVERVRGLVYCIHHVIPNVMWLCNARCNGWGPKVGPCCYLMERLPGAARRHCVLDLCLKDTE